MKYINIDADLLDQPDVFSLKSEVVGIWVRVLKHCIRVENGGFMRGAAHWNSPMWQKTCGITAKEMHRGAPLIEISGDDVCVRYYPIHSENKAKANRANGQEGGRPKGMAQNGAAGHPHAGNHMVSDSETMSGIPPGNHEVSGIGTHRGKRNVREEKERKEKGKGSGRVRPRSPSPGLPARFSLKVRAAEIVKAYNANGNQEGAGETVLAALQQGEDADRMLAQVQTHAACREALPANERTFCPGLRNYFIHHRWRDDPGKHPWTLTHNASASEPVIEGMKNKKPPPPTPEEEARLAALEAITREEYPDMIEGVGFKDLSLIQQRRLEKELKAREKQKAAPPP